MRYAAYALLACGVLVLDAGGTPLEANGPAQDILGATLAELRAGLLDRAPAAATREDGTLLPAAERPWRVALHTGLPQRDIVVGLVRADGERRWLQAGAVPVPGDDGRPAGVVVSFVDITPRKRAEDALRHQALHDPLTGLPNRALFHDRLERALLAARRDRRPLALALLDLDRFKEVNDTLGHQAGDQFLRRVAGRLRGAVRAADTVARLGGDEFAALLPATDADGAAHVARALLTALAEPIPLTETGIPGIGPDGGCFTVGASIGIALVPDHGEEESIVLRRADVALYAAKRGGGGYAVYDPAHDERGARRLAPATGLHDQPMADALMMGEVPPEEAG